jgi:hypothetical protein
LRRSRFEENRFAIGRQISLRIVSFSPEKGLVLIWHLFLSTGRLSFRLASEAVQRTTLTLQRIHDIHGGNSLALGVFSVGDSIANDVLKKDLENTSCLLVYQTGDTFNSSSTCQSTNGRLCNALDVVTKYLTMTLCASLAESLASFTASRHLLRLTC